MASAAKNGKVICGGKVAGIGKQRLVRIGLTPPTGKTRNTDPKGSRAIISAHVGYRRKSSTFKYREPCAALCHTRVGRIGYAPTLLPPPAQFTGLGGAIHLITG